MPITPQRQPKTMGRRLAKATAYEARVPAMSFRPLADSIDSVSQFAPRTYTNPDGAGDPAHEGSYYYTGMLPPTVMVPMTSLPPRVVREEAIGENQVTAYQLKTSGDGNAAVPGNAVQTGAFQARWIGSGATPDLPGAVQVDNNNIKNVNAGKINDGTLDENRLPNNIDGGKVKNNSMNLNSVITKNTQLNWDNVAHPNLPSGKDLTDLEAGIKKWAKGQFVPQKKK